MNCRKLVSQALKRWREINKTRPDKGIGDLRGKYRRFAREARPDLEFLCAQGANPFALIRLIDTHLWWWGGADMELTRMFDSERRRLSSHRYWRDAAAALEKAASQLERLKRNKWAQVLQGMNADLDESGLIALLRDAFKAHSVVNEVLRAIRDVGLDKPGWELREGRESRVLELHKSGRKGRELSGRASEYDWGACAAVLHIYLYWMTGRPHWVSVVRLLHCAGVESFTAAIPREGTRQTKEFRSKRHNMKAIYTDVVRKRIARLRKDPTAWLRLAHEARMHIVLFDKEGMTLPRRAGKHPQT